MSVKTKHVARLARAKNYILITDSAAVINIKDVNPSKMDDQVKVVAQLTFLRKYRDKIDDIIKTFERAIVKPMSNAKPSKRINKRK